MNANQLKLFPGIALSLLACVCLVTPVLAYEPLATGCGTMWLETGEALSGPAEISVYFDGVDYLKIVVQGTEKKVTWYYTIEKITTWGSIEFLLAKSYWMEGSLLVYLNHDRGYCAAIGDKVFFLGRLV